VNRQLFIIAFLLSGTTETVHASDIVSLVRYTENDKKILFLSNDIDHRENFEIKLWHLDSNKISWSTKFKLAVPAKFKRQRLYSPLDMIVMNDGKTICVAIGSFGLILIDYASGKMIKMKFADFHATYGDVKELLGSAAFSRGKEYIAVSGEYSAFIRILRMEIISKDTSSILDLDFKPNRTLVKNDFGINANTSFTCMRFSDDGKTLFTGEQNGIFYGWAVDDSSFMPDPILTRKLATSKQLFNGLWSIDLADSIIITTSFYLPKYGQVQLWNLNGVVLKKSYGDFPQTTAKRVIINKMGNFGALTSDICYIIFSINSSEISPVYNVYFENKMPTLSDNLSSVAFTTEGSIVALGINDNVYLFDYSEGKIISSIYPKTTLPTVTKSAK
jgi:WD40 repeat protein